MDKILRYNLHFLYKLIKLLCQLSFWQIFLKIAATNFKNTKLKILDTNLTEQFGK
jgi:hypothetical protein